MNVTLLIIGIIVVVAVSHRTRRTSEYEAFDLSSMNEKFQIAESTRNELNAMEALADEVTFCSPDHQVIIHLSWLGSDGEEHEYDLYCDGYNSATDRLKEIAEREICDLREALTYECEELSRVTRSRKNSRIYGEQLRRMGEWFNGGKDVRDLWQADSDR